MSDADPSSANRRGRKSAAYDFVPIVNDLGEQSDLWEQYTNLCYSQDPPAMALSAMEPILSGSKFSAKLAHYKIGRDVRVVLQMLAQVKGIEMLDLSDNNLDDTSVVYLKEFLQSSDSLSSLNISDNPKINSKAIMDLSNSFEENHALESFDISNTGCQLVGKSLASVVSNCHSLKKLNAANCGLKQTGIDLASALPKAEKLKRLDLSRNQLYIGGRRLAQMLGSGASKCASLTRLCLSENALDDDMTVALLRGLGGSSSLVLLDISRNNIGENAGRSISTFIGRCSSLKSLNISQNPILNVTINQARAKAELENSKEKGNMKKDKKPKSYVPGAYSILTALAKNTNMVSMLMMGLVADEAELAQRLEQTRSANPNVIIVYKGPEAKNYSPADVPKLPNVDVSEDGTDEGED